jgi:asparagine N-glycosylation enzyme membrane subunit Stt3
LGSSIILAAWFIGAFYLAYEGIRFLLLFVVPFGIGVAFAIGRLFLWFRDPAAEPRGLSRGLWNALVVAVVLLFLIPPSYWGYTTARSYLPKIDSAWWEALIKIRKESRPDAIVTTWWDYGYWVKYVAERRVSADGGTLGTHVPHWLARALVAPEEKESIHAFARGSSQRLREDRGDRPERAGSICDLISPCENGRAGSGTVPDEPWVFRFGKERDPPFHSL